MSGAGSVPAHSNHGSVQGEVYALLKPVAHRLGVRAALTFNLGGPDDYRIPDAGLIPGPAGVWHDTAVLVVEVLSPDDMTFDKLDFYTAPGVRELLVVDWQDRSVRCFALQEGQADRERCDVLGMTTDEITEGPPALGPGLRTEHTAVGR